MSVHESRVADPTLAALDALVEVTTGDRPVAHLSGSTHEHMEWYGHLPLPTRLACWFAVPCRECFPQSPPPGHLYGPWSIATDTPAWPDGGLAWQTAGHDDQEG